MKKLLSLLLLPLASFGQITFTFNDLPQVGTQWKSYDDGPPTGITTVTSASPLAQNWNYSNAFSIDDSTSWVFADPSPLTGSSYFPNSNLGIGLGIFNAFYHTDNSGFYFEGQYISYTGSTQLTICTNSLLLPAPITYGNYVLNNNRTTEIEIYDSTSQSPATMHIIDETKYFNCDAWGTISTPVVSNAPILRLRSGIISSTDSLWIDSTGTGNFFVFDAVTNSGPDNIEYFFIGNGQTIHADVLLDSASNLVISTTYYSSLFSGINNVAAANPEFQAYPNPNSGSTIFISTNDPVNEANYEILNALSNTVMKGSFSGSFHIIETNLTAGIYFVKITTASGTTTKKLIVR